MRIKIKEVERLFLKSKNIPFLIIIVLALIGIIWSGYFVFKYERVCEDENCFSTALVKCEKRMYIKDNPETITQYRIFKRTQDSCEVNVKMLRIKQGSVELSALEDKEMDCTLPLGTYMQPESNIRNCHGFLREEIQEIMIQRMHSQLIENIGEINKEITKVI